MGVQMQPSPERVTPRRFVIDQETGWLEAVRRVSSPNCDPRPIGTVPELIVVHGISLPPGEFGGPWVEALFKNELPGAVHEYFASVCAMRVSAHAFIARSGSVTQFVPFHMRAWHAGQSMYCGRSGCNDFSIGIELEGTDDVPYEPRQYDVLARMIAALRDAYPSLAQAEIVGHSDVAPGRKTDPGPSFDWGALNARLYA
jgi:AmpD protein